MFKKLLLSLATNLVLDLLIGMATRKYEDADRPENKEKWLNIIEFLANVKTTGLP